MKVTRAADMPDVREQQIAEEARAWLLRLRDEDASVDDFAQWHKWLATSEQHRQAYGQAETIWMLASSATGADLWPSPEELAADAYAGEIAVADYAATASGRPTARETLPARRRPPRWLGLTAVLAGVGLVTALVAAPFLVELAHSTRSPAVMEVVTQRGELRVVHLRDGSTVDLGGSSDLKVDFSGPTRSISLAAGEGYFKVAHDKAHPFVVSTRLGQVVAVGTEFDVRLARDHEVVSVAEGRVNVSAKLNRQLAPDRTGASGRGAVQIGAGKAAVLTIEASRVAVSTQPALPPSWREGRLAYRAEPLKYVVADLNRYSSNPVIIADPTVGEFEYSGTVTPAALDDWVVGLSQAFPVAVEKQADGAYVISHRDKPQG